MISIKKYLETKEPQPPLPGPALELDQDDLSGKSMECYRAALLAVGKVAMQISPELGADLDKNLRGAEHRLSFGTSPESLLQIESQFQAQLSEWGSRTAAHLKARAEEVKELVLALARTADTVGARDRGYSNKFSDLSGRLVKIADLDDLSQIRLSIVQRVTELKSSVDQMTRDNQKLVAHLRAEVSTYESKLKTVESLASKDPLTDVANRRGIEERIRWNIENAKEFSIAMLDLNGFKQVNDAHGHPAGDDLLRQFARELQKNTRSGDLVGRWGGDEFIVVLSGSIGGAKAHIARVRNWVFGNYTLRGAGEEPISVWVDAAIGAAEWHRGQSIQQLIAAADAEMYRDKKQAHRGVS